MYRFLRIVSGASPVARSFADRFELKSQAGTGGMGTVYQAIDRQTGQVVAVKILHGKSTTDAARFSQEAALLAELRHPGIVRYVDHGTTSHGESYIAMEWLEGETLEDRLMRGPLSPGSALKLGQRVLEAMAAAHARGIVHRDIKPSNIYLVNWRLDDTRILDFGIARRVFDERRFTKVGSTVGTPMYTAPEQARGDRDVDARADVFSFGSVLYECLTGECPFTGESPMEVMAQICIGAPPRLAPHCPGLPKKVEEVVERMLIQDRRQRPGDAGKLALEFAELSVEIGEGNDVAPAATLPVPFRGGVTDSEQRVMCALMVSLGDPAGNPKGIAPDWIGETAVLNTFALSETGEVAKAIEPFGGHVDRMVDRSLLVTLPSRGLLREQAVQIARCALALRARLPQATLAIATGRAALLAKLPVGPLVDKVQTLSEGDGCGTVHIDDLTTRLLRGRFAIDDSSPRKLMAETNSDSQPLRINGRIAPFVGRDRELATLIALYRESAEEQVSRAALVLAGAGLGKTRLRQELTRAIEAGVPADADDDDDALAVPASSPLILRAAGELVRTPSRYLLLGHILEKAGVDLDWNRPAPEIQDAWLDWLRARCAERPVVLVLEEMQWADSASLQLVDAALRSLKDHSLFVLGLGRPEVDEQFPGLWAERSVERLRLPALSRKAGQTMVRHFLPGLGVEKESFVLDRWEGNPFFLEELVDTVAGGAMLVPESVLGLVEARFEELEPEVRRVARAASVFGDDPLSPEGVIAVLGENGRRSLQECFEILVTRDILQRCVNSGEMAYRFRHRLAREAAYRMLPPGDRALARRLARAWLENTGRTLPEFLIIPLSQSASALAQF